MKTSIIECVKVKKTFKTLVAVRDLSLSVLAGEILSILGPSGCGKTTVLRLMAGLETPVGGEIFINGTIASKPHWQISPDKRGIGMVMQDYALFPHMTVSQNIEFGLDNLEKTERIRRLKQVTKLVRLENLGERYPHELSGGQQQRVAIARSLAPRPFAMLLDEPFSNIDAGMRIEVRNEIRHILASENMSAVLVTHDRDEAFTMSDRVAIMVDGALEQIGQPESVYHEPLNRRVAELTGMCDFIKGIVQPNYSVKTELGSLQYNRNLKTFKVGTNVDLVIRPEDFTVDTSGPGQMMVAAREFRGDETLLSLSLPSGALIKSKQPSFSHIRIGERLDVIPTHSRPFPTFETT